MSPSFLAVASLFVAGIGIMGLCCAIVGVADSIVNGRRD